MQEQKPPNGAPILVVDDNKINRDILALRLVREGFEVTSVASGEEALALARPDAFHLVLLDIVMPGLSGLDVVESLRQRHSAAELPVIMVTARDDSTDVVKSLRLGANDHVSKPIDFPVLLARIQTQLKLRALSRLKDEFLRIASHDLRNPLSFVAMSAQAMADDTPPGAPLSATSHSRLLRMAVRCADMERIIHDFLDFEVLEDGAMFLSKLPTNLNGLVEATMANQEPIATVKNVALSAELDARLGDVTLDRGRIQQVIDNLVCNAIKFGRAGDRVLLRTRRTDDEVVLEVVDSGRGVPADELPQLFGKYKRLSTRPTAGESSLGIGLFICKQIIDLHGGSIGANNNPDAGCTFWFRLSSTAAREALATT